MEIHIQWWRIHLYAKMCSHDCFFFQFEGKALGQMAVGQNQGYHFEPGEFTTHFRTYFSGWIESDVHWGLTDLDFDPWPFGYGSKICTNMAPWQMQPFLTHGQIQKAAVVAVSNTCRAAGMASSSSAGAPRGGERLGSRNGALVSGSPKTNNMVPVCTWAKAVVGGRFPHFDPGHFSHFNLAARELE